MDDFFSRIVSVKLSRAVLWFILAIAVFSYGGYRYYSLDKELDITQKQFAETSGNLERAIGKLASTSVENRDLGDILTILRARNSDFQNEILEKGVRIATFEKLVSIDPELLKKYSKVFFLNENYIPAELSLIEPDFIFNKTKPLQIQTKIKPFLENLLRDARTAGTDISVLSAYRSFGTQATLKSQYKVVYGANTSNSFSADQGYSEHQLGTTVDFTTKKTGEALIGFDKTPAYTWLLQNAYRYGFILSYPKSNTYYIFEPWHFRFVGAALATDLYNQNKNFYDLSEREIDSYLIKLFD